MFALIQLMAVERGQINTLRENVIKFTYLREGVEKFVFNESQSIDQAPQILVALFVDEKHPEKDKVALLIEGSSYDQNILFVSGLISNLRFPDDAKDSDRQDNEEVVDILKKEFSRISMPYLVLELRENSASICCVKGMSISTAFTKAKKAGAILANVYDLSSRN